MTAIDFLRRVLPELQIDAPARVKRKRKDWRIEALKSAAARHGKAFKVAGPDILREVIVKGQTRIVGPRAATPSEPAKVTRIKRGAQA
ncbi:MAG: hypothetical protein A2W04_06825 [Betaproteobacteria bacterium RBG_16_64_9]|nr:MAG: hypothetical protein A2W04_06825 [Betaproteobacteria bacterium RBG_16_64_9]